jgi:hypothetical protein
MTLVSLGLWLSDRLTDLHGRAVGAAGGIEQYTLAFVNAGENFSLLAQAAAHSHPSQARNVIRVDHKDARKFASFHYCGRGDDDRTAQTFIQLQPSKHAGPQSGSRGQINLDRECMSLRVTSRENLTDDTAQRMTPESVNHDFDSIAASYGLQITLGNGSLESQPLGVFHPEQHLTWRGKLTRFHILFCDDSIERGFYHCVTELSEYGPPVRLPDL